MSKLYRAVLVVPFEADDALDDIEMHMAAYAALFGELDQDSCLSADIEWEPVPEDG